MAEPRILGRLGRADGKGVVRLEDRFDTDVNDVWEAITDPQRLARWLCEIEGDLREGGEYRIRYLASGWEGQGRIEACEPPTRLLVVGVEDGEATEQTTEVTLRTEGEQTVLVLEGRGMPADNVAGYGAGLQVELEDLAAHLDGRERCDSDARMEQLYPAYQRLKVE